LEEGGGSMNFDIRLAAESDYEALIEIDYQFTGTIVMNHRLLEK